MKQFATLMNKLHYLQFVKVCIVICTALYRSRLKIIKS